MPDEIKIDAEKFDRILGRMLNTLPLSKEEISERVQAERDAKKERVRQKYQERRKARKIGQ
jgi:hypothetical protein